MGTMTMGRQCDEAASARILDCYLDCGGNFVDVAENYPVPVTPERIGRTETIVGNWLKERGSSTRSKLVVATKVAGPLYGRATLDGRARTLGREVAGETSRIEPQQIRDALEASLLRLQTEYIDLYQLHWPDRYSPLWGRARYNMDLEGGHQQQERRKDDQGSTFDEVAACMQALVDEGKIREWGVSNETTYGVCSWISACKQVGARPPVSIQNDFSLLDRRFESELAEACSPRHHNLGLLAYGVLAGGALSGKYLDQQMPNGSRHEQFPSFQSRYFAPPSAAACEKYRALAAKSGLSMSQLALAWAYKQSFMGAVIIGATSEEHVRENLSAADLQDRLSEEVLAEIDGIHFSCPNPNVVA